ncbi:iron ABC transporter permease [Frigidibacter sp. MR17.14]|uniref:FecCD family ABC transporter permease n=1 Tax=Frigidibacter sp. MR17.14 TaxID=3126509 RepID=UPI003012F891
MIRASLTPAGADPELRRLRRAGRRRHSLRNGALLLALLGAIGFGLCWGQTVYPPATVLRVLAGSDDPGLGAAAFTLLDLRLPRLLLGALAGAAFGLGGTTFQLLLRNPLASPDIIGISAGAGAAAVVAIVGFQLRGPEVSIIAVLAGLATAALIYALSWRGGVAGARLILVGIGLSSMAQSVTAYTLSRAPAWSLQEAMRWMAGSLNGAGIEQALPLLAALLACGGLLAARARDLGTLRMGDDMAAALGIRVGRARALTILAAVGLVATATAATGPIAFVAFLAGPIAARLVGRDGPLLLPAALTGALLVLLADIAGQSLLPGRLPVGIVTGVLGAPWLIAQLLRRSASGETL